MNDEPLAENAINNAIDKISGNLKAIYDSTDKLDLVINRIGRSKEKGDQLSNSNIEKKAVNLTERLDLLALFSSDCLMKLNYHISELNKLI